jgi:ectoine hydroxylase-related dioxygenase (phytanoyl-CoA dioxygenase family)
MKNKIDKYIKKIRKDGYAIIPNLVSKKQSEMLKTFLNKDYQKYKNKYFIKKYKNLADKQTEKVVFNLHNKNLIWFKLFENKKVISILNVLLKEGSYKNSEPYYLNNISARCPMNGHKGQLIHLDSNLAGVNYNIIVNVMWVLDAFNKNNGSTYIVPKSHMIKRYANNDKVIKNKVLIKAKQGSVIIFNANLWHGGSEKKNDSSRWAVLLGYARWFIKPSFDYMKNTPKKIFKKLTNEQKSLLGFDLIPPKDEFTRMTRRSNYYEIPENYKLK